MKVSTCFLRAGIACSLAFAMQGATAKEVHRDLVGYKRCIPMEAFLRTDPGLRQIGQFRTRESSEIES